MQHKEKLERSESWGKYEHRLIDLSKVMLAHKQTENILSSFVPKDSISPSKWLLYYDVADLLYKLSNMEKIFVGERTIAKKAVEESISFFLHSEVIRKEHREAVIRMFLEHGNLLRPDVEEFLKYQISLLSEFHDTVTVLGMLLQKRSSDIIERITWHDRNTGPIQAKEGRGLNEKIKVMELLAGICVKMRNQNHYDCSAFKEIPEKVVGFNPIIERGYKSASFKDLERFERAKETIMDYCLSEKHASSNMFYLLVKKYAGKNCPHTFAEGVLQGWEKFLKRDRQKQESKQLYLSEASRSKRVKPRDRRYLSNFFIKQASKPNQPFLISDERIELYRKHGALWIEEYCAAVTKAKKR